MMARVRYMKSTNNENCTFSEKLFVSIKENYIWIFLWTHPTDFSSPDLKLHNRYGHTVHIGKYFSKSFDINNFPILLILMPNLNKSLNLDNLV